VECQAGRLNLKPLNALIFIHPRLFIFQVMLRNIGLAPAHHIRVAVCGPGIALAAAAKQQQERGQDDEHSGVLRLLMGAAAAATAMAAVGLLLLFLLLLLLVTP
jgi:hypothetical protein